ncbi:fimbrial biogenesis chaperone [Stenotrophomonas maltophilia]|uniref:fimbrial biogenesis chaperone n=1 Tax=Stenotrophomonas maltophilia TaxID=40324 RepID=UPI0018D4949D|nr:fimbria/pilus periplasmic chaperone [Stenotrophomonas geniculata]MBH1637508.1 molecular chaperone [Stenotrophomonas maltophilia]HEL7750734.1 molecular chaperone [Stenotrophomonas maltophilia]
MKAQFFQIMLIAVLPLIFNGEVMASVVVNGTRVIYPADSREVTVQVDNVGSSPALVQAWIDGGDASQAADSSDAPFVLTPPISRVEPGRSQALRLMFSGGHLPSDRESLFWLNVLDIPPSPESVDSGEQNYLQVALRSRLKLFYRPQSLKGIANDAPATLRWIRTGDRLRVENPSPFHVTLAEVHAVTGSSQTMVENTGAMVAPKQSLEFTVPASTELVRFITINDYGGQVERTFRLDGIGDGSPHVVR